MRKSHKDIHISKSLRTAFQDRRSPDYGSTIHKSIVYVSTVNTGDTHLPEFKRIKFVKAMPQQLRKKVDEEGGFMSYTSKHRSYPFPALRLLACSKPYWQRQRASRRWIN